MPIVESESLSEYDSYCYSQDGARTLPVLRVKFGDPEGISELIRDIGHRRGVGNDLADGSKKMSEKFGGKDFAMHVKGLELSGYDPRGSFAQGVEYATTNRGGCHVQGLAPTCSNGRLNLYQ